MKTVLKLIVFAVCIGLFAGCEKDDDLLTNDADLKKATIVNPSRFFANFVPAVTKFVNLRCVKMNFAKAHLDRQQSETCEFKVFKGFKHARNSHAGFREMSVFRETFPFQIRHGLIRTLVEKKRAVHAFAFDGIG